MSVNYNTSFQLMGKREPAIFGKAGAWGVTANEMNFTVEEGTPHSEDKESSDSFMRLFKFEKT